MGQLRPKIRVPTGLCKSPSAHLPGEEKSKTGCGAAHPVDLRELPWSQGGTYREDNFRKALRKASATHTWKEPLRS